MNQSIGVCPHCSSTHPPGTKFCPVTGKEISRKCPLCWTRNPMENTFCQDCGADLSKALFGIPLKQAEEWGQAFDKRNWPRTINDVSQAVNLLKRLEPALDSSLETIVCLDKVSEEGWLVWANINGRIVQGGNPRSANIIVTNWRVIALDYGRNQASYYPYQFLERASLSNQAYGTKPSFLLGFGSKGTLELTRSAMPAVTTKPAGTLSRMFTAPHISAMKDLLLLREVDEVKSSYERNATDNSLYVGWFNFVIESRQKF